MLMCHHQNTGSPAAFFCGRKVWVTGHRGMLGSAMLRKLGKTGAKLLFATREELDLTDRAKVLAWVEKNKPELVFHIAAKVGGIYANATMPASFLQKNLLIEAHVIEAVYQAKVQKLLFVASNCMYPEHAENPISEDALLTGQPDSNIRYYAISKIAGVELCRAYRRQHDCDFVAVIPPNLYGPGDNYHPEYGHIVAGILRRAHEAKLTGKKELVVWGDGTARRELLHVNDVVRAMELVMRTPTRHDLYNIGCGHDLTVAEIAQIAAKVVGFKGRIIYDRSKPNGAMRKLLDNSRIRSLGWDAEINEFDGMQDAYADFLDRQKVGEL